MTLIIISRVGQEFGSLIQVFLLPRLLNREQLQWCFLLFSSSCCRATDAAKTDGAGWPRVLFPAPVAPPVTIVQYRDEEVGFGSMTVCNSMSFYCVWIHGTTSTIEIQNCSITWRPFFVLPCIVTLMVLPPCVTLATTSLLSISVILSFWK